ncbi:MAG: hypothetical protein GX458_21610 [Phyllobacteriaceae bacterium]|nr:hypothetical protein [Phyllobacteriaceae bacterium]
MKKGNDIMTLSKLTLAALALGASLTPALADSGSSVDDRLATFLAARHQPKAEAMVEGRQAAAVATTGNAVDTYLEQRNARQSH